MELGVVTSKGSGKSRVTHLLMALAVLCVCLCSSATKALAEETVTRGEWIHELVQAADIKVDSGVYPDNYFTDLKSTDEYYTDVLAAVDAGLIDLKAGSPVELDKPATRAFVAHSANAVAQYDKGGDSFSFSDSSECAYPEDAQVAVNRGWFDLRDGKFCDDDPVSKAESTAVLDDLKAIIAAKNDGDGHANTWKLAEGVKEVPQGTDVDIDEDSVVTINKSPVTISKGDVFVVYPTQDMPLPYRAESVSVLGGVTRITTTQVSASDAFTALDVQIQQEAAPEQIVPEEGESPRRRTSSLPTP